MTAACLVAASFVVVTPAHGEWFKGNTHCHTAWSWDSDVAPASMLGWYRDNGYDFVVLTDHDDWRDRQYLQGLELDGEPVVSEKFVVIPGEELTPSGHHTNGIGLPQILEREPFIHDNFALSRSVGGLPQLNHPEFNYLTATDLAIELAGFDGPFLFEVYNAHPAVVRRSDGDSADIWDGLLSRGVPSWGVAVDDAHDLPGGRRPPGGGFVMVQARELTEAAILESLATGRFYATTGVTIDDFFWSTTSYTVVAPDADLVVFVGEGGRVLGRSSAPWAVYEIVGHEGYVRAEVFAGDQMAWTQPVFVSRPLSNQLPRAVIDVEVSQGGVVLFDASRSRDPDGQIVGYRWNLGQGRRARGETARATYPAGEHHVHVVAIDEAGGWHEAKRRFFVE